MYPKAAAVGLAVQILFLPLVGFGLANLLPMDPVLAVGLMLLAACPGGATSNLITWLARGDTALSVTLTAISSFVSVLTIPLILSFSLHWFMGSSQSVEVPFLQTVGQTVVSEKWPD
ncbi:MAG: bile acid:sodium symporter [Candidatus Sericytochromatia bacterium]|nr:bile acid:sodium symporter [Candidatus Sericytochromatia bacterium]